MANFVRRDSIKDVEELRRGYTSALSGPLEPYIEEIISYQGIVYEIVSDGRSVGYFCVSPSKVLLQFHICPEQIRLAADIFGQLVSEGCVERALVLTRDPLCVSLSMDLHKSVSVRCYLFDDGPDSPGRSSGLEEAEFRVATAVDIPMIRAVCGDFHDFLDYTLESSVERGEIFVLFSGEILLGTGVVSAANSQPPHVDIGMCVGEDHRRRNVGTHIVRKLREHCRRTGLRPGASCQFSNTASKKTLEKAGMVARDRVLEVVF